MRGVAGRVLLAAISTSLQEDWSTIHVSQPRATEAKAMKIGPLRVTPRKKRFKRAVHVGPARIHYPRPVKNLMDGYDFAKNGYDSIKSRRKRKVSKKSR